MKRILAIMVITPLFSLGYAIANETQGDLTMQSKTPITTSGSIANNSEAKNDKPIVVGPGKNTITVQLPANATTGYQWFLTSYNNSLIKPKSYSYKAPTKKLIGAGGTAVFKLEVTKRFKQVPQMQQVTFSYARAWNINDNAQTKVVTIISRP